MSDEPLPGIDPGPRENPDLRLVVNQETGEMCPGCLERDHEIAMVTSEKRSWHAKYRVQKRKNDAEARRDQLWPQALELFKYWQEVTHHSKARFTEDRFWLCRPFLDREGLEECKRAVDGRVASDWHMKRGKYAKREGSIHDHFHQIFESQQTFEIAIGISEERDQPTLEAQAPLRAPTANVVQRLRDRIFLLEVTEEPDKQAKLMGEIHELTEGGA